MSFICLSRQNDPRQQQPWTRENEQRQDDKLFIVTGGSEGIGTHSLNVENLPDRVYPNDALHASIIMPHG